MRQVFTGSMVGICRMTIKTAKHNRKKKSMPYNFMGDLYNREIVEKLQKMGYNVKSVNALNKIMEKMGLLVIMEMARVPLTKALSSRCGTKVCRTLIHGILNWSTRLLNI